MVLHLQLQDFFTDLFVGNVYSKESIEECLFIWSRNLVTNSECATGIYSWLLPLFTLISKVLEPIAAHIPPTWTPSTTSLIWSLSVLLHTITSFAFQKSSQLITCKGPKAGISFIYAFNPIILLSCALSPAPSLLHLLIVLAHYSATRGWSIVLFICLTLLVTGHSELYCVIPAYLVLLRASKNKLRINGVVSKSNDNATCLIKLILVLLFTAFAAFLLRHFSTTSLQKGLHTNSSLSLHSAWADWLTRGMGRYHPAAGVFWYLDAQVFDQYSEYFFLLVNVQPLLFVVPLLLRLSHSKPLHTVNLTLATVIFYRRETSFADIVFLAGLVITYHSESVFGTSRKDRMTFSGCIKSISEPNGMRFLPIILLSTCVPLILSPLMMSLWMQTVSGNANFPFFQGLIFWVFFAFTIIEFANQTVREIESN